MTRPFRRHLSLHFALAALFLPAACSSPSEPAVKKLPPGIRILSRPELIDTIGASLPGVLVLEIRGADSLPARGAIVTLSSAQTSAHPLCPSERTTCRGSLVELRSESAGAGSFSDAGAFLADSNGRLSLTLRNGRSSGEGALEVTALDTTVSPRVSYSTSIPITVRPGQPFLTRITPRDTVLSVGRRATFGTVVFDRGGALLGVTPTITATAGIVVSGFAAEPTTLVDGKVIAQYPGTIADTASLRVVPPGTVAGAAESLSSRIVFVDLDGVNRRTYDLGATIADLDWTPDGSRVIAAIYDQNPFLPFGGLYTHRLVSVTPDGVIARFPSADSLIHVGRPYILGSGTNAWLYASCATRPGIHSLCRMRLDGSGLQVFTDRSDGTPTFYAMVGVSPDGATTAYTLDDPFAIAFQDIATGTVRTVPVPVGILYAARWNPAGTRVAYTGRGGVSVMNVDGTNLRSEPRELPSYAYSVDWSPDGRWILAEGFCGTCLVEEATMRRIDLPFRIARAAWRP